MTSTAKRRPKFEHKTLKANLDPLPSSSSLGYVMEPPKGLFPSKAELGRLVTVVAIASSVAFACNLLAKYLSSSNKPFCDSSTETFDPLPDLCQPCPNNGECREGKLECNHGYRKKGDLCVQDGDIHERARKLSEWVEARLCEAYARRLCSRTRTGTSWVPEDDIWRDLDKHQLMENLEYPTYHYLKGKIKETSEHLLETRNNPNGTKELKCPDMLVEHYKPVVCRLHQWVLEHILVIIPAFALLLGFALVYWKVRRRRHISARVEELYLQVCDILEESALASNSSAGESDPWVVASWLRDHLLLPRERKDPVLWRKVEELVQEDSRVDRYPRLVKGESKVVWEWQADGLSASSRSKEKGEAQKLKSGDVNSNSKRKHHVLTGSTGVRWKEPITVTKLFD